MIFKMKSILLNLSVMMMATSAVAFANEPPSTINAVSTPNGVVVSWNDTGASNYRVYRELRTSEGSPALADEIVSNLTQTNHNDPTVVSGSIYNYFVVSCNADQVCGNPSNGALIIASITGNSGGVDSGQSCPAVSVSTANRLPMNVTLDTSGNPVTLTWVPPEGSVRWNVYRNDVYEFTTTNGLPAYEVENHIPGNTYYITAVFEDGSISPRSLDASESLGSQPIVGPPAVDCSLIQAENDILNGQLESLQAEFDELVVLSDQLITDFEALSGEGDELVLAVAAAQGERDVALADLAVANQSISDTQAAIEVCRVNINAATTDVELQEALTVCTASFP